MTTETKNTQSKPALTADGKKQISGMTILTAVQGVILFIIAGTLSWPAAWAYLAGFFLAGTLGMAFLARHNPAVLNERGKRSENTETFDKIFQRIVFFIPLAAFIIAGLDERYDWTAVLLPLQILGLLVIPAALAYVIWTQSHNPFAARVVRLQEEEGQYVIKTGPYRYTRHPMYTATLAYMLALPLALGSWWVYLPAIAGIALFFWRTAREDQFLQQSLPGYREYTQEVPQRLIPGLW